MIRDQYIQLKIPRSKPQTYCCPTCGSIPSYNDLGYRVRGVKYPKYFNEREGSTPDGNYHDWDEVHYCKKCKQEFYFENGAY